MKTIKEIAEQLEVSKPTVSKAIKTLGIEKQKVANRIVIDEKDVERIAKLIAPEELEKSKKTEKAESKTENSGNNVGKIESTTEKTENAILIEMLQKALDEKEQTIKAQQNQIDMLIKSNAMLTARLEDKQQAQEQKESVIVAEQKDLERRPLWKRIFNIKQCGSRGIVSPQRLPQLLKYSYLSIL